jgi:hypothetical protein
MKGVPLWLLCWACRAGTRNFCSALAALVGPVQNIFSHSPQNYLNSFVPYRPQAGQAAVLGRLSLIMLVWSRLYSVHEHAHLCIPHFQLQSADTHTEPVNVSLNRRHLVLFLPSLCCKQQYIQLINLDCTNHHKSRMSVYRFTQAKNIQSFGLFQIFFPFFEERIIEHRLIMIAGMLPE